MANNWNDTRQGWQDWRQSGRQDWDNSNRSDERRSGSYGQSSFSDRTYDPNRYRSEDNPYSEDRGFGSRDRSWNFDRDSDRGFDRGQNYGRGFERNYDRDYERGVGSDREFNRDRWGSNEGSGYGSRFGDYGRRDENVFGSSWNRSGESLRSDQMRGGSGLGYGGSERFGAGSNYGMSGSEFSRGSGYGGSYGANYGAGADQSYQRANYAGRGPKGYQRSDERIKEEVSEALARHPDIDASEIEIEVAQGLVTLRGSVDDRRTKRMAEDTIESLSGVRDVRNELTINKSLFERAKEMLTGESSDEVSTSQSKKTTSRH